MKRLSAWLAGLLALALLAGCANAGNYVQDHYPLVDVQGKGRDVAKMYMAENKDVPTVAHELANQEHPKEMSKDDPDRMFLVYSNQVIHVQKDPKNEKNSVVEIDSVPYAQEHYGSSFLQGYLTASILHSMFGGGWFQRTGPPADYRGYTSMPNYSEPKSYQSVPKSDKPSTTDRTGSFTSKGNASSSSSSSSGNSGSGSSSYSRKSDGSTPTYKAPSNPSTSSRGGSFKSRRR